MPISRGDRFKLMCHIARIAEFNKFKTAFWKEQDKVPAGRTAEKPLRRSFNRWRTGGAIQESNHMYFLGALKNSGWPEDSPTPEKLLEDEYSVAEFLERCNLSYDAVADLLSVEAKKEWSAGHHNLHFMKALDNQSRHPRAKVLLPNLIGTYRLYRRHSMLPGILREHFIVDQVKDGHCEGWYIQFARAHPPNIIPFNAYFCEFYVIAFGAHQAVGRRTEIVTVSVLVENAFSGSTLISCDDNNKYFVGILTGIYDSGNVLLAERVLIEKKPANASIERVKSVDGETTIKVPGSLFPVHVHRDSDRKLQGEYNKVADVIDNSLDGQTLTARPNRIELVRG